MKAVLLSAFAKDIPSIKAVETPIPKVGPYDILIRVSHVAPTFGDGLVSTGKYQTKPPFPFVPGTECCGTVAEVGSQVTRFTKGMRVVGFNNPGGPAFGAWSEYALFPEFDKSGQSWIYESPPFLRDREAVAVMANYPTALYAFCNIGSTPLPDEKPAKYSKPVSQRIALVHGGAGGMGTASIHIAKHYLKFGTVIATCSTPEKAEIAKACGADHVVDYSKDDWVAKVREICRTKVEKGAAERDVGVDVVMETVGNSLEGSIKCARWGCRIVIIGFAGGEMPKIRPNLLLVKGIDICGCWLGGVTNRLEWSDINTRVLVDCFGLPSSSPSLNLSKADPEYQPSNKDTANKIPAKQPLFRPVLYPGVFVGIDQVAKAIGTMHGRKGYGKVVVDLIGEDEESKNGGGKL